MSRLQQVRHVRRVLRGVALAGVLAVTALVVPQSSVQPTDVSLVKIRHAQGVSVGDDVVWILAVGSDARPGQDMTRSRGDALQLVGINTRTGSATAIGVPRDSWVSIPGHGREKINSALYFAGPRGMAGAMRNLVGIEPDYVMVTRFPFFEDMVDDIGGITVTNPRRFYDPYLKKEGFAKGRIHLDGYNAMAFSRIRKGLAGGDFDRSANQQRT
jgi:LCP family protein required for cell wall assembly